MSPFVQWAWSKLVDDDSELDDDGSASPRREKKRRVKRKKATGLVNTLVYVDGLCCPSEVPVIDRTLRALEGVQEVGINPAGKTVTVRHDAGAVDAAELVSALNTAALGARLQKPGGSAPIKRLPVRLLIAAALLLGSVAGYAAELPRMTAACSLLSVLLTSPKIAVRAAAGIRRCHLDINILTLVACTGALGFQSYVEAAMVLVLFSLGDFLESRITIRARGVIAEVLALRPEEAELPGGERVPVGEVAVGTTVVVRQGDSIPTDGVVTAGALFVDESALSGESKPVSKDVGSTVWAGTTNLSGYAEVKTTAQSEDSAVGRLVKLVEEAQSLRSGTEQTVEKFARYYTPCILIIAGSLMIATLFLDREHASELLYIVLVLLVVACPCALVISTPVTYMSGIACAATHNILVRGGVHLEALGAVKAVTVDKTGTLTEGRFRVRRFEVAQPEATGRDEATLWRWIATLEARSSHPLALALAAEAQRRGVEASSDVADYREVHGDGVHATVEGVGISIGGERLAARMGWASEVPVDKWAEEGGTVLWVGDSRRPLAVLSLQDAPRPEAADAMAEIRDMGIAVAMLTGDGPATASAVGRSTGIDDVKASMTPDSKIAEVLGMRSRHGTVCMVGDGVNDVPALAASHVGVAMGAAGRPAALEAADVVLMDSNLMRLAFALRLGRCVLRKVRQNLAFALVFKAAFVILTLCGYASILCAVVADVGSMLLVMLNGSSVMLMSRERQRVVLEEGGALPSIPAGWGKATCMGPGCADNASAVQSPLVAVQAGLPFDWGTATLALMNALPFCPPCPPCDDARSGKWQNPSAFGKPVAAPEGEVDLERGIGPKR